MKIIIIGGGPAGLAAALRLKQVLDAETVVYEVRCQPTTLGGAVQIPPNGLRLLKALGVYEEVANRGFLSSRLQVHSMRGELLADLDRSKASSTKNEFGFMRILRQDLLQVLLDAVHAHKIAINFSKNLTAIDESEKDITVTFADGSMDTGDIVLGCDGIHSVVRRLHVDPSTNPIYSGISNMFGLVSTSDFEVEREGIAPALHATMTPEGLLAVSPYTKSADRIYWFYSRSLPPPDNSDREGWEVFSKHEVESFKQTTLDLLHDATGDWNRKLSALIRNTETVKFYPIFKMPASTQWYTKRCLLLGDAAHAMQPHIGQGTSMALEDVFFLSRLLADSQLPLEKCFSIYDAVRRPRIEEISKASADRGDSRGKSSLLWQRIMEVGVGVGFWIYKTARLDKLGVGMDQRAVTYDIMSVPILEAC